MSTITDEQFRIACARYVSGESSPVIARDLGVVPSGLVRRMKAAGVEIRDRSQRARKYVFDETYFDRIDTEQKAYWLGFIAADGNVYKRLMALTLARRDRAHLECFRSDLGTSLPILDYEYPNTGPISTFRIRSEYMAVSLLKHGITPRKSFTLAWPATVPAELMHHFTRGYFDGNGSVYGGAHDKRGPHWPPSACFSVVSNVGFLERYRAFLADGCGTSLVTLGFQAKVDKRIGVLRYNGRRNLARIIRFLYADATVWLPRKREKAETLAGKYLRDSA